MKPIYFGLTDKNLYGVYHSPQSRKPRSCGIVLCYPIEYEHYYLHRAYLQLAIRLIKNGFHVLRFDYYGFGDSAGESKNGSIAEWISNIETAIEEIRNLGNIKSVSLIGYRLGATLVAMLSMKRSDINNILLWDPIVNGSDYLEELLQFQENWLLGNLPNTKLESRDDGSFELLGMHISKILNQEIKSIDLLTLNTQLSENIAIIENNPTESCKLLTNLLIEQNKSQVEYKFVEEAKNLFSDSGMDSMYVPNETLKYIVDWYKKGCE